MNLEDSMEVKVFRFDEITPAQLGRLAREGFIGEVDGDEKVIRVTQQANITFQ